MRAHPAACAAAFGGRGSCFAAWCASAARLAPRSFPPRFQWHTARRRRPSHESHAVRSAGHSARRLGRGGAGVVAPADPQVLREDARRPGQRRGSAALHQSRQPHPERSRPARALRQELAVSAGTTEQRIAHVVNQCGRRRGRADRRRRRRAGEPAPEAMARRARDAATPTIRSRAQPPSSRADRARRVVRPLAAW